LALGLNFEQIAQALELGFAAKSLLVGLGVGRRSSVVSSRSFQAFLPSFFVPVYVLKEG